jgi:multidrug efflux pump subunit AcrA (membrane-fusion protein)
MSRIVTALAAVGGAVWTITSERQLRLDYQINLKRELLDVQSEDSRRHVRLLQQVITSGEAKLVPPMSGSGEPDAPGNPTQALLVLAPMKTHDSVEGVLEVLQRSDTQPGSQQGYLRFLVEMSDLVGDWLKSRKLRHFSGRQEMWAKIDEFSKEVHNSLDIRDTAYTIANEGRRLIECDRVSVTVTRGHKQVVEAISGQDTMDTRSNIVTLLSKLATRVCATGEPLWYNGDTKDLPPQLETALEDYVDESHTKSLAVLPLFKTDPFKEKKDDELGAESQTPYQSPLGDVIGSVIIEQIDSVQSRELVAPRVDLVCQHSARALGNALEHNGLFLMPVWRAIGKSRWLVTARNLPKTLVISGLILGTLLALVLVRKDFVIGADGTLEPVIHESVWVKEGGEVAQVLVDHGSEVKEGDALVILRNNQLEQELQKVRGDLNENTTALKTIEQILSDPSSRTRDESRSQADLFLQKVDLQEKIRGAAKEQAILEERKKNLTLVSPIHGRVTTWDVENLLRNRTLTVGDSVMQIANPREDWELEVYMRGDRIGKFEIATVEQDTKQLPVSFVLKGHPAVTFQGQVVEVQNSPTPHEQHGHSYRMRIRIDKQVLQQQLNVSELNIGAEVKAKVHCGRAPLIYCWFYELLDWVRIRLWGLT